MKILIDNGHGEETAGKRSPDGKFREYRYAREIAKEIETYLKIAGIDAERLVPEENDVPLSERVRRVNSICDKHGKNNVVLISVHCNASKNGEWGSARGWCAFTSKGETKSDELATMLYKEAEEKFEGHKIRKDFSDGDEDWEENFYILRNTKCPAVLTENFFMDNVEDLAYLNSEEGRSAIVEVHVAALKKWHLKYGKG